MARGNVQRKGMPLITFRQVACLTALAEAKARDDQWQAMKGFRPQTLNILTERDWIFRSRGVDGSVKYCITGRGEMALRKATAQMQRKDKLCPMCGERKRKLQRSGKLASYCVQCSSVKKKLRYVRLRDGRGRVKVKICPRCKVNKKHTWSTGRLERYCLTCKRELARLSFRASQSKRRAQVEAGLRKCSVSGCDAPAHVIGEWVQGYCLTHYREYRRLYARRKAIEKVMGKGDRKKFMPSKGGHDAA